MPVHFAAMFGRFDAIKWIFANGYELNATNVDGESPLHLACRSHNLDAVKFLADQGIDMTLAVSLAFTLFLIFLYCSILAYRGSRTPLFYAVEAGCLDIVRYLVSNGCDIHHVDSEQNSLLHIAVSRNDYEMVKLLVSQRIFMNSSVCLVLIMVFV